MFWIFLIIAIVMAILVFNFIYAHFKVIEAQLNLVNANLDHVIASIDLMDERVKLLGDLKPDDYEER